MGLNWSRMGRSLVVWHAIITFCIGTRRSFRFLLVFFLDTTFSGVWFVSPLSKRAATFSIRQKSIITVMGSRVHQEKTYRTSLDGVLLVLAAGGFPTGVLIFGLHRQYWRGRGQAGKDIAVLVANLDTKLGIWDGLWELVHLFLVRVFICFRCTIAMVAAALPLVAAPYLGRVYTGLHRKLVGCVAGARIPGYPRDVQCLLGAVVKHLDYLAVGSWRVVWTYLRCRCCWSRASSRRQTGMCMRIGSVVLLTGNKKATYGRLFSLI